MSVTSWQFFAFSALIALTINRSTLPRWRNGVMVIANIAFVFSFTRDPVEVLPLAGFVLAGFAATKIAETRKSGSAYALMAGAIVFVYLWLRHYAFVPHALFLPISYLTIGLSYVFFRTFALLKYAYQTAKPLNVDLVTYVNFLLTFTSFIAGPIQSTRDFRNSRTGKLPDLDAAVVAAALERIAFGLLKVVLLSPLGTAVQTYALHAIPTSSAFVERALFAALAAGVFPFYLYANFSGYMDIVAGVSRLLRIDLPENFGRPFEALGFIDFWGRWHITLSNWLKTYVFSPLLLALMRRLPAQSLEPFLGVAAYFITFCLVGVWHGQTSEFLTFGALQGLGVSGNKLYQIEMVRRLGWPAYRELCARPVYRAVSRGLTISYFAFTLIWFWGTWPVLTESAAALGAGGLAAAALLLLAVVALGLQAFDVLYQAATNVGEAVSAPAASPFTRAGWAVFFAFGIVAIKVAFHLPSADIVYARY